MPPAPRVSGSGYVIDTLIDSRYEHVLIERKTCVCLGASVESSLELSAEFFCVFARVIEPARCV